MLRRSCVKCVLQYRSPVLPAHLVRVRFEVRVGVRVGVGVLQYRSRVLPAHLTRVRVQCEGVRV